MTSRHYQLVKMTYFVVMVTVLPLFAVVATAGETPHSFQLTITSNITSEKQGQQQRTETNSTLRYALQRKGQEVILTFEEVRLTVARDGRKLTETAMSRAKYTQKSQGQTEEIALEDAPDELKKTLQDSFGAPICKVLLDENGKELKRTVVAGAGAKGLIETGQIANARLFHPGFPAGQDKWQELREVSMGPNGYVRGTLTYEKIQPAKGRRIRVKVSGTLTKDEFRPEGIPFTYRDARYGVSGEQVYDAARREWVAGELLFQVSFRVESKGKAATNAKGTMRLKLEPASPK